MSLKIVESMEAVNDVIDAANYIAQHAGLNTSDKFLQSVKNAYHQISEMPSIGSARDFGQPDLQGMRRWHVTKFPKYLIFYMTTDTELIILRVLHGARDIETIFTSSEE